MEDIVAQAQSGGRHSGYFDLAASWPTKQLERAMNNYAKQVEHHFDKIDNPEKYIPEWETFTHRIKIG